MPMKTSKKTNVKEDVVKACEEGNLIPSNHAQDQMAKRDVQFSDVEEAVKSGYWEKAKDCKTEDGKNWKYSLRGKNAAGDKDIRIIVVFADPKVIIVTAIDKNKKED
jgi:hypothetical protein